MFTGLVRDIGTIRKVSRGGGDLQIYIETAFALAEKDIGASISCNGCCLTVESLEDSLFSVSVSEESLSKTCIGEWREGTEINLERSLKLGDELGGHLVFGHVDGVCRLEAVRLEKGSHRLRLVPPTELMAYIAPKGSVALDGVSLTVNEVDKTGFGVNIIPHTWEHTNLRNKKAGDMLHIEIDMLARYVARQLEVRAA